MPAIGAGVQGMRASINAPATIEWLLARERNKFNPELSGKNLATERLRLLSEQADREALDNARRRGEVIEYEDAEGCFMAVATILNSRLDGVAGRLANELVNEPNAAVRGGLVLLDSELGKISDSHRQTGIRLLSSAHRIGSRPHQG
jgi:hypothetical protein